MKKLFQVLIVFITIVLYSNLGIAQTMKNYVEFKGTKYELGNSSIFYNADTQGFATNLFLESTTMNYVDTCFQGVGVGVRFILMTEPSSLLKDNYEGFDCSTVSEIDIPGTCYWINSSTIQIILKDGSSKKYEIGEGAINISNVSTTYTIDGTVDAIINAGKESAITEKVKIHFVGKIETL